MCSDPDVIESDTNVLVHEILHALGFSKNSFSKFRDSSGIVSVLAHFLHPGNKYTATQIFSERGTTVSKLVSPNAVRVARDYFGCPTLNGMQLAL